MGGAFKPTEEQIQTYVNAGFGEKEGEMPAFVTQKPHLAHYTSLDTIINIIASKQIWFSNPLFMNDHQEFRMGMDTALTCIWASEILERELGTPRFHLLRETVHRFWTEYATGHLLDTFVFSLSNIEAADNDGALSMWRGYGWDGAGAAIVFDTAALSFNIDSPFVVEPVRYLSPSDIKKEIDRILEWIALGINSFILDDQLTVVLAERLFENFKVFALVTKHIGFAEEQEWRVIYLPERDETKALEGFISYSIGEVVQPRLKFPIEEGSLRIGGNIEFEKLANRIILGPNAASVLSVIGFKRAIKRIAPENMELPDRVFPSTIPYRSKIA
jgi:hypothetical protein